MTSGSVIEPGLGVAGADRHQITRRRRRCAAAVASDRCSARQLAGAGQVRLAVLHAAIVEQPVTRWRASPRRAPARAAGLAATSGRGVRRRCATRRVRAARRGPRRRRAARARRPSRRPASAGRAGRSWSSRGQAPAANGRSRPSQSTNVPAFSTAAATGKTTSATSVTAEWRSSRRDQERHPRRAPRAAAAGSGRSAGSTPPTTSPSMRPS